MATGTAVLDFGATPTEEASVIVTGQTGILAGAHIEAFAMRESTGDNGVIEHEMLAVFGRFSGGDISGTQFIIKCALLFFLATGQFNVRFVWVNP